jgi:hypothetical protein
MKDFIESLKKHQKKSGYGTWDIWKREDRQTDATSRCRSGIVDNHNHHNNITADVISYFMKVTTAAVYSFPSINAINACIAKNESIECQRFG